MDSLAQVMHWLFSNISGKGGVCPAAHVGVPVHFSRLFLGFYSACTLRQCHSAVAGEQCKLKFRLLLLIYCNAQHQPERMSATDIPDLNTCNDVVGTWCSSQQIVSLLEMLPQSKGCKYETKELCCVVHAVS